jgi:hypothetical protein
MAHRPPWASHARRRMRLGLGPIWRGWSRRYIPVIVAVLDVRQIISGDPKCLEESYLKGVADFVR